MASRVPTQAALCPLMVDYTSPSSQFCATTKRAYCGAAIGNEQLAAWSVFR
jgi:hypothetical protein